MDNSYTFLKYLELVCYNIYNRVLFTPAIAGFFMSKFNTWLALKITSFVGSMPAAYIFSVIAFTGIPAAMQPGGIGIVNWFVEEFCQFVLLSIIIVGQNQQAKASEERMDKMLDLIEKQQQEELKDLRRVPTSA